MLTCGHRFAGESLVFNGVLLTAAWRFKANSSRGQAHARRLFLVSLAYLPVFFVCLLLHQKRRPADDTSDGEAAVSSTPMAALDDSMTRVRERGREFCHHEMASASGSGKCPIPLPIRRE